MGLPQCPQPQKVKRYVLSVADVKPSNVLINKEGHVKMCDFGISGYLVDSVAKTLDAGCKPYMAVSGPHSTLSPPTAEVQEGYAWEIMVRPCPLSTGDRAF